MGRPLRISSSCSTGPSGGCPWGCRCDSNLCGFPVDSCWGTKTRTVSCKLQTTRFHLNWRKREGFYPSYHRLIHEFEQMFHCFSQFVEKTGVGKLALNQWELTYIDAFPREEYWTTPADWAKFLPGLFGQLFPNDGLDLVLECGKAACSLVKRNVLRFVAFTALPIEDGLFAGLY